jgi:pyrimidine-nucleoside phosphorylase
MVDMGEGAGRRMVAWISGMEQPLGCAVGNSLEVREAIDTLRGGGPEDLIELILALGSDMLFISGIAPSRKEAEARIADHLVTQKGLNRLRDWIAAQGGDPSIVDHPDMLPQPKAKIEIEAQTSGYVSAIDALEVGVASKIIGAGRKTKDDAIDYSAGIYLIKKIGDKVRTGDLLAVLHSDGDETKIESARKKVLAAYTFTLDPIDPPKLLYARITKHDVEEF